MTPDLCDVVASGLAILAPDHPEHISGVVVDGETYTVGRIWQEWAVCGCADGAHEFRHETQVMHPQMPGMGRGFWHMTRRDADDLATQIRVAQKHIADRVHVVTHLVANTTVSTAVTR